MSIEIIMRNIDVRSRPLPNATGLRVGTSVALGSEQLSAIASQGFRQGELVFVVTGPVISEPTIYSFQLDATTHIEPIERYGLGNIRRRLGIGHYVNHSCDPNTGFESAVNEVDRFTYSTRPLVGPLAGERRRAEIRFRAIREIRSGEEVTFDYATNEYDTVAQNPCRCGSPDCRGRIHGYRDLPSDLRERYTDQGIIPPYLLDQAAIQS